MELLLASNVDDYDSIDEILLQTSGLSLEKILKRIKGLLYVIMYVRKEIVPQHKRETIYNR